MGSSSQYFKTFLTSEASLERKLKQGARQCAFTGSTAAEAGAWQDRARRQLALRLGMQHFTTCPPKPEKVETVEAYGLLREEWRIQTEPDVWMPFYIVLAKNASGPLPLVLCPHGHGSGGKWATAARSDIPAMADSIKRYNYGYGVEIARAGFAAVCPDARGFGQRREPWKQNDREDPARLTANSCHELMIAGGPLGLTVQGMWTWDLMRLLDYLAEDSRIDTGRTGCAGLSGGGLQTLNLAALDQRIHAAVVSGYFYGVKEALLERAYNCECNLVPGLWLDFDMGDIGALIAPRALFIETGDADPLNGRSNLANVTSQIDIARKVYQALGAGPIAHHVFSGGHRWDGSRAVPWLKEKLQS